jgi:tetratricopeptide (TPR) repeat protein
MKGVEGDLDRALAEAVTIAVDDVLLDRLLERLETVPLAKDLLVGAAVYRVPVGLLGLVWQVGEEVESEGEDLKTLEPEGFEEARLALEDLGFLARVGWTGSGTDLFIVHRWTASAVLARAGAEEKAQAHHRAARFWRWRVPQSRAEYMEQLLEARHHHYEAGEIVEAVEVTWWVVDQFGDWGAYRREEQLCREVLGWLPRDSAAAAKLSGQLGIIAYSRGDLAKAEIALQTSFLALEAIGDRWGMATTCYHLGLIAQDRGELSQALEHYQKALQIAEKLGNRSGMAESYRQLGTIAQLRGELSQALAWYQKSLQINEELGNRGATADSYRQLGMFAQDHGELLQALEWYQKSFQIYEELSNRVGMAMLYHQLGLLFQDWGELSQALEWYQKSLQINEELGNRAGMVSTYHNLGMIAQERGELSQALEWYQKSLQISEKLGNRAGMASAISRLGVLATERGQPAEAVPLNLRSLAIRRELGTPVRTNLHWLRHQRDLLGAERFGEILQEHLDADAVLAVLEMMEEDGGAAAAPDAL